MKSSKLFNLITVHNLIGSNLIKRIIIKVHLIHAGFEFPLRFYRHDRERLTVIETDGGGVDPVQVRYFRMHKIFAAEIFE